MMLMHMRPSERGRLGLIALSFPLRFLCGAAFVLERLSVDWLGRCATNLWLPSALTLQLLHVFRDSPSLPIMLEADFKERQQEQRVCAMPRPMETTRIEAVTAVCDTSTEYLVWDFRAEV